MSDRTSSVQRTRRTLNEQQDHWEQDPALAEVPQSYRVSCAHRAVQPSASGAAHHSVGSSVGLHPDDQPFLTDEPQGDEDSRPSLRPARVPARATSDVDEGLDVVPTHRSARRYRSTTQSQPTSRQRTPAVRAPARFHFTVYIGLALLCMVVGFIVLSMLGSWWQRTQDDWHYGMPRTFQMDAVVGHHDSAAHPSHFVALNLGGHLSVIEMPGGDLSRTMIYAGPIIYAPDADRVAVTLSVAHDGQGHPQLLLHYQNSVVVFVDGPNGKFHSQAAG